MYFPLSRSSTAGTSDDSTAHDLDPRSAYRLLGPSPRTTGADDALDGFVTEHENENHGAIHCLMQSPVLYDPLRTPRFPIVLCHRLYGFDVRGPPSLHMQYWSSILGILHKIVGTEVIVSAVPGTGSIASRTEQLNRFLQAKAPGHGINFMVHSMGGLDCCHLITHLKPVEYTRLSLTTIATPHRGSPFMDWCKEYPRTAAEQISAVIDSAEGRATAYEAIWLAYPQCDYKGSMVATLSHGPPRRAGRSAIAYDSHDSAYGTSSNVQGTRRSTFPRTTHVQEYCCTSTLAAVLEARGLRRLMKAFRLVPGIESYSSRPRR
ncbi:hypothetical protein EI94DRAFT_1707003 [Lactarius quietus]|nr:hypothetical protein EI94DRAFT_1707003 [Lactarius quietus]